MLQVLIKIIRDIIVLWFSKMKYSYCYTNKEYNGTAVFGLCNGCDDINCPYYIKL